MYKYGHNQIYRVKARQGIGRYKHAFKKGVKRLHSNTWQFSSKNAGFYAGIYANFCMQIISSPIHAECARHSTDQLFTYVSEISCFELNVVAGFWSCS